MPKPNPATGALDGCALGHLSREERMRLRDEAARRARRERERPNTPERVRAAAYVAAGNAHAVAVQGGDPAPLRRRARHLHFRAARLHVTARIMRTSRPRARTSRPRSRARRAARRGSTRGSPGGGEPGEPEPGDARQADEDLVENLAAAGPRPVDAEART